MAVNSGVKDAVERSEKFNITAACEVMAILSLSDGLTDLKRRLGRILVAYTHDGKPVFAHDLHAEDAMAILLKDAVKPNLVQTLGGTPALVHCGPFANIAHGCNSVRATKLAMTFAPYTVTEAGFGADLGAEKFLDVKCRIAELKPNAVVVVATVRALKLHGGADKNNLSAEDTVSLKKGMCNLIRHVTNIRDVYHLPVVVAINRFTNDTRRELNVVKHAVEQLGVKAIECDVWSKGGKGAKELALKVVELCQQDNSRFEFCYADSQNVEEKIRAVATKIYGASEVRFSEKATDSLKALRAVCDIDALPVVIAKTQYSFSDDPKLLGAPSGYALIVRDVEYRGGAGFVVAIAGNMLLMPGLPKTPNAVNMTVDSDGKIDGLY